MDTYRFYRRYLGNVLLSVFLLLTAESGSKVWIKKSEVVAVMSVTPTLGPKSTHLLTSSGKLYVKEDPEAILKELEDVAGQSK